MQGCGDVASVREMIASGAQLCGPPEAPKARITSNEGKMVLHGESVCFQSADDAKPVCTDQLARGNVVTLVEQNLGKKVKAVEE